MHTINICFNICVLHRDQSGNCCQPGGHCEHPAVSSDAEVLEGKALSTEASGKLAPLHFIYACIYLLK